jgi:hypothetical protein
MPRQRPPLFSIAIGAALALAACSQPAKPTDPLASRRPSVGYINGTAKVLTIDKPLGHTVLEIDGREVQAYWLLETDRPQGGTITAINPVGPGVGQYEPPIVRPQNFDAVPGDTIAFVGLKSGDDILLRGIKVVAHAK